MKQYVSKTSKKAKLGALSLLAQVLSLQTIVLFLLRIHQVMELLLRKQLLKKTLNIISSKDQHMEVLIGKK